MSTTTTTATTPVPLVMQLIVDGESASTLNWPKGPWMAQSAHASIAAIQISSSSPSTIEYISPANLPTMHKVVLQTASTGKSKMTLHELSAKLTAVREAYEESLKDEGKGDKEGDAEEEFPKHFLWVEQPENVATCLAIAPNRKPAALKKLLRSCTLLKD
ncbi:uncharacterized protein UTRI_00998_B [Ustilago trichophora]|uniref:peptidyl-tRNA hydrolase n=1 Tax=Ustilago trichophora TaxID=86804 RepID=A0A5C3DW99_9BASI|nr:uncharacterized protein UTRI_00998_B [Ustilago trichophora]